MKASEKLKQAAAIKRLREYERAVALATWLRPRLARALQGRRNTSVEAPRAARSQLERDVGQDGG